MYYTFKEKNLTVNLASLNFFFAKNSKLVDIRDESGRIVRQEEITAFIIELNFKSDSNLSLTFETELERNQVYEDLYRMTKQHTEAALSVANRFRDKGIITQ